MVAFVLLMGRIIHLIHSQRFFGSGSPLTPVSSWFRTFVWVAPPFSLNPLLSLPFGSRAVRNLPRNPYPYLLRKKNAKLVKYQITLSILLTLTFNGDDQTTPCPIKRRHLFRPSNQLTYIRHMSC
jgi:hypothetical protein